jgi:GNAT superfamily N-acetyltransferase
VSSFVIRTAEFPRDKPAALVFIDGLQEWEYRFEKNRRLDSTVAADHFATLEKDFAAKPHAVYLAEAPDLTALGWAVAIEQQDNVFVVEPEQRFVYIAELYLVEAARGAGAGRALIAACEDWARSRGVKVLRIGVLSGNARAHAVYRAAGFADYAVELRKYL